MTNSHETPESYECELNADENMNTQCAQHNKTNKHENRRHIKKLISHTSKQVSRKVHN